MTTIHLVRHGQKESHAGDPGLTQIGIRQAQQTGKYLSQFPITKIVSSPFKRTIRTAEEIAQKIGLSYDTNPALVERMNWNDESISRDEFIAEWIASTHNRDYQPKWGDSSRTTGERITNLIISLQSSKPTHIVLVTHGGAIADYLRNHFADQDLTALHKQYPEGVDFQLLNCSVTRVAYDNILHLELANFVEHLGDISE